MSVLGILTTLGDCIEKYFGADEPYISLIMTIRESDIVTRVDELKKQKKTGYDDITNRLISKVKEKKPEYQPPALPAPASGGCYVATAVYGSYDCPEVWTLRRFRDDTLAETWYGRVFIRVYYAISPTLVKWFGKTVWFTNLWKPPLDRMVGNLKESGVEDTPYDDKKW